MPELPRKKVGLVSCSGEEMAEGTVTRLATLKVLDSLRPGKTVTICLPLFLAGGEGDRAFARFHPTIAIDGCEKRCAARGTERYSSKPAVSIVVRTFCPKPPAGLGTARHLNEAGMNAVTAVAGEIVRHVDGLLGNLQHKRNPEKADPSADEGQVPATVRCSCGSGIPVAALEIAGRRVEALALPLVFDMFRQSGKAPGPDTTAELMETVRLYNSIPEDEQALWREAIEREYAVFCAGVPL
jgi:uncharacterized metal-binding protein